MKTLRYTFGAVCAMLLAATVTAADLKPTGTVYLTSGGSSTGTIQWRRSSKTYEVTAGRSKSTFKADEVARLDVKKPDNLDALIKQVKAGRGSAAIAGLTDIAEAYENLTYDVEATRWVAEAHLAQGDAKKAVAACEKVIRSNPAAAYSGAMAIPYWEALRKSNKMSDLNKLLEKAIASGDRVAAASALVARGDSRLGVDDAATASNANCEAALRDGYLRVILLYADPASEAYPAALYKGAQAFKKMGQSSRANALLEKLKAECPGSSWALKK